MAVPAFSDISKPTKNLLTKDFYHLNQTSLEVETNAPNGVKFKVDGKTSPKEEGVAGKLEASFKDKQSGLTLTESWSTANVLTAKVELDEAFTPGLKGELDTSFLPASGAKNAKLGLLFQQPAFHARAYFDLLKGPVFTGDAVVGHEGFVAGAEIGYDILGGKIKKYAAALGYTAPLYSASVVASNNLSVFAASYYHRVNPATEAGATAVWDSASAAGGAQAVGLEFGVKHIIDSSSFAKAKINSQGIAALAYSHAINPSFTVGLGASFDSQRLAESAPKVGLSLKFVA
jgi:voltage-dependent anion channel protein 2